MPFDILMGDGLYDKSTVSGKRSLRVTSLRLSFLRQMLPQTPPLSSETVIVLHSHTVQWVFLSRAIRGRIWTAPTE
jgi:hypothetical protein